MCVWHLVTSCNRQHNSRHCVVPQVRSLIDNLQSAATVLNLSLAEPSVSQPLPPSSLQRFLRARQIPGVVIADYQSAFSNKWGFTVIMTVYYIEWFIMISRFTCISLHFHCVLFVPCLSRYYESYYDNVANLNLTYPPDLSPEGQLEYITDTAKVTCSEISISDIIGGNWKL